MGIDKFYNLVQAKLGVENSTSTDYLDSGEIKLLDFEPAEIARQLTLLEYDLFKAVKVTPLRSFFLLLLLLKAHMAFTL